MPKIKPLNFLDRLDWVDTFFYELAVDEIQVTEHVSGGQGTLTFQLNRLCLMLKIDYGTGDNHTHLKYLKQRQHGEAIIIELDDDYRAVRLHIIEMKSRLTEKKWKEVLQKFEGALYDSLAVMGLLGLEWPEAVVFHVAYTQDGLTTTPSPSIAKAIPNPLSPELRQWHYNAVNISWLEKAPLSRILRDENGNAAIHLSGMQP